MHLVPVSIFVGRAPDKQSGWFAVLFSENWALVGRFRRLLGLLLNGRNTIVRFAPPISLRSTVDEGLEPERTVRKLQRVLRTHFRRIRESVIGPDLSTRRLLVDQVLAAEPVREAIAAQAKRDNSKPADAWKKAHAYAWEIAADYSSPVVRSASFMLSHVWNRIYAGVLVHHLDKFKAAAPGHEVVYVPSHRSHMDYLLLSYLLYDRGIVPPHIVAGINLNLPVVGTLLRKGGAFFIRRSIRGNALYSAVLSEYVAQLVAGGYSLEYFVEGGRSRTGRLLQPKGGMISMTLRAFLRQPRKPVLFQPVYIGYEKLMEGGSYLDELSGRPKERNRSGRCCGASQGAQAELRPGGGELWRTDRTERRAGREGAGVEGRGGVRGREAGLAVDHGGYAGRTHPGAHQRRRRRQPDQPAGAGPAVHAEARDGRGRPDRADRAVQDAAGRDAVLGPGDGDPALAGADHRPCREINVLTRIKHPLGDVLSVSGDTAVLLSYFRNNVLHLFTASSWVACCFQNNRRMSRAGLVQLGRTVYPFLQAELFLPWSEDEFAQRIDQTINVFVREGLLQNVNDDDGGILARNTGQTDEVFRLRAIGHSLQQAFERYYIAISVLVKNGPGVLGAAELESLCQQAAQRLSLLYARRRRSSSTRPCSEASSRSCASCAWCGRTRTASCCSTSAWMPGPRMPSSSSAASCATPSSGSARKRRARTSRRRRIELNPAVGVDLGTHTFPSCRPGLARTGQEANPGWHPPEPGSGRLVGNLQALQPGDAILQLQLAPLQALGFQFVLAVGAMRVICSSSRRCSARRAARRSTISAGS